MQMQTYSLEYITAKEGSSSYNDEIRHHDKEVIACRCYCYLWCSYNRRYKVYHEYTNEDYSLELEVWAYHFLLMEYIHLFSQLKSHMPLTESKIP